MMIKAKAMLDEKAKGDTATATITALQNFKIQLYCVLDTYSAS